VQLQELLADVDVLDVCGDPSVDVRALAHDSRRVEPGACFACIVGANEDGHDHAPEALRSGAVALLVERHLGRSVPEARVASVRRALGPAAAQLHGHPSRALRCLGVTGTNGKTTTTHLLAGIAAAAGERAGVVGTVGAGTAAAPRLLEHTTPEAPELQALLAQMRADGVRTVAMEVSSHALAQHRVDGTWFEAVCFTNLTRDHLDYHASLEDYFEAKARLFEPATAARAAVNVDDRRGVELARRCRERGLPVTTYAVTADADVVARAVRVGADGCHFTMHAQDDGDLPLHTSLLGSLNVANALAAAVTARLVGFDDEAITAGVASVAAIPGRLERVDTGQPFTVLVDYAHTPDALRAALSAARQLAGSQRVLVVFGAGGDRDAAKRPLMGRAAATGADVVVVTDDNPRSEDPAEIAAAVVAGAADGPAVVRREPDRRSAIRSALDEARAGDVVLIAGKGHETEQRVGDRVIPFDDRVVAREELGTARWN
jgi:UDP-N-acetylmuramoyl-L-alanyl-D-glutamate--2,6-diaminopimelate ligase